MRCSRMRRLGKGLSQLLGEQQEESSAVQTAPPSSLVPNPNQPRKEFAEEPLQELVESIKRLGVLQPIVVRPLDQSRYEIIAGERRWRAATLAGLDEVPIIVRSADTSEALQIALVENLQREDISALECAEAYQVLITVHGLTQEEVSRRVGKSRSGVANALRLLKLPIRIRESLSMGAISEGHARALLQFDTESEQLVVFERIIERGLNVRDVEKLAQGSAPAVRTGKSDARAQRQGSALETALSERLGAPCRILSSGAGGKLEIEYFSDDDLSRILELLQVRL
jgi:ParB family chromosome partitioning protein